MKQYILVRTHQNQKLISLIKRTYEKEVFLKKWLIGTEKALHRVEK